MRTPRNIKHRSGGLWLAALIHRLSGLLLVLFLPLHFLFLGLAIEGAAQLQDAVAWTQSPLVKFAESALVFLLSIHLLGGLRVLVIENLPWRDNQKQMAAAAAGAAVLAAVIFFVGAL